MIFFKQGGEMSKLEYINNFTCRDCRFNRYHMAGSQFYRHPCMALLIEGKAEFLYEGKKYEINKGDLVYIARGTKYFSVWSGDPEIRFYSIHFSFSKATDYDDFPFQVVHCNTADKALLDDLMELYELAPLKSIGLFYTFLEGLYSRLELSDREKMNYQAILPALEYIDKNCTGKFSVLDLAKLCHLSQSHFFALFKKIMGCAPIEYKNNLLVQKSLELLSSTNKTIEEISYELGFSYPSYFRRVFKALTGQNPKDVRKKIS